MHHKFLSAIIPALAIIILVFVSCQKTDLALSNTEMPDDPNLVLINTLRVDVSTLKPDTFATSGDSIWPIGFYDDPELGRIFCKGYTAFTLPEANPLLQQNYLYDSVALVFNTKSFYMGDTATSGIYRVYRLAEKMINEESGTTVFSNNRQFSKSAVSLGESSYTPKPSSIRELSIRLSDDFGKELYSLLRSGANEVSGATNFEAWLNGLAIEPDSTVNAQLVSLSATPELRLYYRKQGVVLQQDSIVFSSAKSSYYLRSDKQGTPLEAFSDYRKQVLPSANAGNKAYVSSLFNYYMKIGFPDLFSIKEKYDYVQIVKAELVLTPDPATYRYPYFLPPQLNVLLSLQDDQPSVVVGNDYDNAPLTGNLVYDDMYRENAYYTYDITSMLSLIYDEGVASTKSLFIAAPSAVGNTSSARVYFNSQDAPKPGIKLNLYVLGF